MKFLFVGSQVCPWASFRRPLAESPLPLASRCCFITFMQRRFSDRGLTPYQFTPMLGVHHAPGGTLTVLIPVQTMLAKQDLWNNFNDSYCS